MEPEEQPRDDGHVRSPLEYDAKLWLTAIGRYEFYHHSQHGYEGSESSYRQCCANWGSDLAAALLYRHYQEIIITRMKRWLQGKKI